MSKAPDLSPHIAALSSDDGQAVLNGLASLLTADVRGYPQNEQQALNMSSKVSVLLSSSNAAVRMAAARLAARMAQQFGVLPASMRSDTFLEALWSILSEFGSKFTVYKEALGQAEQAAALAEAAKKPGGKAAAAAAPAAPADLESALPVPSKQCLEATLRCLTSLATLSTLPTAWLARNCNCRVEAALLLLQHHSPRVQLRALLCLRALSSSQELCSQLLVQGLVQELVRLLRTAPCGALLIGSAQLLLHLCQQGPGPQLIQVIDTGAVDTLLQLLLAPESLPVQKPAAAAAEEGDAAAVAPAPPSPAAVDFITVAACRPVDLQLASAALLHHLASVSLQASGQLLEAGALNLLLAMLPSPPKPGSNVPGTSAALEPEPVTPFFPSPAAPQDETDDAAGSSATASPEAGILERTSQPLPKSKAGSHQLQAHLLELVALVLAGVEVQQAVWEASERSALVPFLTNFLAEPEAPAEPAAPEPVSVEAPAKGGKGGKEAKGKPMSAKGAKAAAVAEPAPSTTDVALPPFPPAVRVAALHCLTQLARHPDLAAAISTEAGIRALIPAGGAAARVNPSSRPAPQPTAAAPVVSQPLGAPLAEAVATLLQLLLEGGTATQALGSHKDIVICAKGLAATAHSQGSMVAQSNSVRMVLLLPEADLIAPARPPPPSPPKTPPPLPLATSQFVWDALGRPSMTDGSNVKLVHVA